MLKWMSGKADLMVRLFFQDIKNGRKDILAELAAVIHPKYGSLEVKKWCGRIAGMIGASLVDEFDE